MISWIGFRMTKCISTFSTTSITTNTALSDPTKASSERLARLSATLIGTDTICAPITSFSCQPKPLLLP